MRKRLDQPDPFAAEAPTASRVPRRDPAEDAHLELVRSHPGFWRDLRGLVEEFRDAGWKEGAGLDVSLADLYSGARRDPNHAPYPIQAFSRQWGLSPATVLALALSHGDKRLTDALLATSREIRVWDEPLTFTLTIPKPVTEAKLKVAEHLLAKAQFGDGPLEPARETEGKRRRKRRNVVLETLPYFLRWNAGDDDLVSMRNEINAAIPEGDKLMSDDTFRKRLQRTRERLRALSPDGIREDPFSFAYQRRTRRRS